MYSGKPLPSKLIDSTSEAQKPPAPEVFEPPLKVLAISVSLASLQYLWVWHAFNDSFSNEGRYFTFEQPAHTFELSLIANVLAAGLVLFALDRYLSRRRSPVIRWAYRAGFLGLVSLGLMRAVKLPDIEAGMVKALGSAGHQTALYGLIGVAGLITLVAHPSLFRAARIFLLVLSPLLLVQVGTALWMHWKQPVESVNNRQLAPKLHQEARQRRVIWMVFDEMDQQIAFPKRPPDLLMPELDRFRKEAVYATAALPPARWTKESIASLLTGRVITGANPIAADELGLRWKEGTGSTKQGSIFSEMRTMGLNSGAVGWYHPYCRMYSQELSACAAFPTWEYNIPSRWRNYLNGMPFHEAFLQQFIKASRVFYSQSAEFAFAQEEGARLFRHQESAAAALLEDRTLDFLFLHFSIPHPPGIYDRRTATVSSQGQGTYLDNFALVDRVVGEIRRRMEADGSWEKSVVLISSDHSLRRELWLSDDSRAAEKRILRASVDDHVPFLLKLPLQKQNAEYHTSFNTALSSQILLAIQRGEVQSPQEVVRWLDSRH